MVKLTKGEGGMAMRLGLGEYVSCGLYICATIACLVFLIFRYAKKYRYSVEHGVMTFLLWNIMLTGIIETTKLILAFYNVENLLIYQKIGSYLYFLLHTTLSPAFALYVLLINGAAKNKGKKFFFILFSGVVICEILVLITPFTNGVFYYEIVDGYIEYRRGFAMTILYVIAVLYLVYAVVFLVKSWNVLKTNYMNGYQYFLVLIALGIIIQLISKPIFGEAYEVEAFFESLAVIGLLLVVDCNDALIDDETKLRNGSSYKLNVNLYQRYHYKYTIINIRFVNLDYYFHVLPQKTRGELLEYLTNTITSVIPNSECYRYSNDTFVIIIPKHPLCEKYVKTLTQAFDKALVFDNNEIFLQTVISVAKAPNDVETLDEHIKVMGVKPKAGRLVNVVSGDSLTFLKRQTLVDEAIRRAIKNKSFEVYYQPIWDKETNSIVSAEALCRLNDEILGPISPAEFIPLAEETGSIISLGDIVIEKVCKDISELRFMKLGIKYVELNLSLYQLRNDNLKDFILDNLEKYNVSSSMINLEITETKDMDEVLEFNHFIEALIAKGFSFSLDDYGTAYSNLANVISIQYRNIKIDSSILWKSITDYHTKQLLELTIKTFRNFGNNVVQEGVETKEQLDLVCDAGANLIQGFYFSKPLPKLEFVEYVKNFKGIDSIKN